MGPLKRGPSCFNMIESEYLNKKHKFIAGADEVGRGPLAGPVVAACVAFKSPLKKLSQFSKLLASAGVMDSKKLTDKRRREILSNLRVDIKKFKSEEPLSFKIENFEIEICIAEKSPTYIEDHNILKASLHAMRDAFLSFKLTDSLVLLDGNKKIEICGNEVVAIVKGDAKSTLIGLASIVAKIYRDDLMYDYAKVYPNYDFEKNAGYPTAKHRASIVEHGITPIHRKTFKGVLEYTSGGSGGENFKR